MYTKDDCIKSYNSMLKTVSICRSFSELYVCSSFAEGYLRAMRDLEIINLLEFFNMLDQLERLEENAVSHINGAEVG